MMNKEDDDMTEEYYKGWRYSYDIDDDGDRYSLIHIAISESGEMKTIPHSSYERISKVAFQRHVDQGFIYRVINQPTYSAYARWRNSELEDNS